MLVDLPNEKERERMSSLSIAVSYLTLATLEILRLHLRDEKLSDNVDLSNIARRTQYYSGSDLKS
jgi:SpoVK/Ycf46/Vps4 family AAA+-type ATPase